MLILYPAIRPYKKHTLAVDETHQLYLEECGEPNGLPILFVHGGPGFGSSEDSRRYFDPNIYRIVVFDQRGCGRSTPHGNVDNNNTQTLIDDMEKIREFLNIDRWVLFGGSWGATLSLLYAEQHPENVLGLILRGVYLNRECDRQWLFQSGLKQIFPDFWEDFVAAIPKAERNNMLAAYHSRLFGYDELTRMAFAKAWALWEGRCATLNPNPHLLEEIADPVRALPWARIECHYLKNHCFIEENQIINHIDNIKDIPGIIIHGRYDMVCLLDNAWVLHLAWPISQLNIIRDAGHSADEPAIIDALIRATKDMAHLNRAA